MLPPSWSCRGASGAVSHTLPKQRTGSEWKGCFQSRSHAKSCCLPCTRHSRPPSDHTMQHRFVAKLEESAALRYALAIASVAVALLLLISPVGPLLHTTGVFLASIVAAVAVVWGSTSPRRAQRALQPKQKQLPQARHQS